MLTLRNTASPPKEIIYRQAVRLTDRANAMYTIFFKILNPQVLPTV